MRPLRVGGALMPSDKPAPRPVPIITEVDGVLYSYVYSCACGMTTSVSALFSAACPRCLTTTNGITMLDIEQARIAR